MTNKSLSLWTRRDPFAEFDALIRSAFGPGAGADWPRMSETSFVPAAEVTRDGDDAVVRLELPGLDVEKDVDVEVANGRLVVRGERRDERSEDGEGRTLREIRYGSFTRSFDLPEWVSPDAVSASYNAGVLTVTVAGAHKGVEPRKVQVSTGSQRGITANSGETTQSESAARPDES